MCGSELHTRRAVHSVVDMPLHHFDARTSAHMFHPEQLALIDPFIGVDVACWYWDKRQINRFADADDVKAVTKAINGGFNGLDDRVQYLSRAKAVLGITSDGAASGEAQPKRPVRK